MAQEPVLFNNTVYENICLGFVGTHYEGADGEKKRELVETACMQANAHAFIQELPQVG